MAKDIDPEPKQRTNRSTDFSAKVAQLERDLAQAREQSHDQAKRLHDLRRRLREAQRRNQALRGSVADTLGVADQAGSSLSTPPLFFLVGRAKSGTTWLMRILDSHPEILCKGEGRIVGREYRRQDVSGVQPHNLQPSSLISAILDSNYLRYWVQRSVWTRDGETESHLANLTRVAAIYFLSIRLIEAGKRIVGDKTPFLGPNILREIHTVFPDAKVVHIFRDGRDVAVSAMHHLWNHEDELVGKNSLRPAERAIRDAYREDPDGFLGRHGIFTDDRLSSIANSWREHVARARRDGPRLLTASNYAEVRYEDLLEHAQHEVSRLLGFLGANASEHVVHRCIRNASFETWTEGRRPGEEDSTQLLRKGIAGDWRNVFTDRDKEIFKKKAGDLLIELGYEQDLNW